VFAGAWRVLHFSDGRVSRDTIEVADWPHSVRDRVFADAAPAPEPASDPLPEGVFNAPALLTEIAEKVANWQPGAEVHSINLSLLPHTEEDLSYLVGKLGKGDTIVLSRGYGNCRVSSTGTRNVWWVQYYNSQDALILNSAAIFPSSGMTMCSNARSAGGNTIRRRAMITGRSRPAPPFRSSPTCPECDGRREDFMVVE